MKQKVSAYNVRVYGLLINQKEEILLSKERMRDRRFTKFPGGGHELGEGLHECLKREFYEELQIEVEIIKHFYTTDFFQLSAFDNSQQLISVYYLVRSGQDDQIQNGMQGLDLQEEEEQEFYWKKIEHLQKEELTYPIDQKVVSLLKSDWSSLPKLLAFKE